MSRLSRLPLALVAPVVALVGLLLVVLGVLRATAWAPSPTATARISAQQKSPVVVTAPSVLDRGHGTIRISASSTSGPVFLGVAHAPDAAAWLGAVARTQVEASPADPSTPSTFSAGDTSVPDPRNADIWVAQVSDPTNASLAWPDAAGQWQLVAASDGTAPAPDVVITWTVSGQHSSAPALIAVGLLLLLGGAVATLVLRRRDRSAPVPAPEPVPARGRRALPPDPVREAAAREAAARESGALATAALGRHATPATGILRPLAPPEPPPAPAPPAPTPAPAAVLTAPDTVATPTGIATPTGVATPTPPEALTVIPPDTPTTGAAEPPPAAARDHTPVGGERADADGDDRVDDRADDDDLDDDDLDEAPVALPFRQPPTSRGTA